METAIQISGRKFTAKTPGVVEISYPAGDLRFKIWANGSFKATAPFDVFPGGGNPRETFGSFTREKTFYSMVLTIVENFGTWYPSGNPESLDIQGIYIGFTDEKLNDAVKLKLQNAAKRLQSRFVNFSEYLDILDKYSSQLERGK